MIIIDAIEIDERFASHLVGPDPFLRDQFISFRFAEFAIATPLFKFDEPAPLIVVVISHGAGASVIFAIMDQNPRPPERLFS
jgi:hypothetical protein